MNARSNEITSTVTDSEVQTALAALSKGDLILVKGDIAYGLMGCSDRAIQRMYQVKGRVGSNPCIVIGNLTVLADVALVEQPLIQEWIERTLKWTTLAVVLPVNPSSRLLASLPEWVRSKTVTAGTVAVFLNLGRFLEELVRRATQQGLLIVGSSANPSGQGNIYRFEDIPHDIRAAADLAIDHGTARYANERRLATTIVNFTNGSVKRCGVNGERITAEFLDLIQTVQPLRDEAVANRKNQ